MRVLATVVTLLAPPLALARVCRDPCLEAARTSYVECRQGATEELASERQLCRDGDPACVQACAARQGGCSTTTGIGAALETCLAAQQVQAPGWQFEFMPYAWLSGMFGRLEVKGRTADTEVTVGDVLTLLWHGDAFTVGGYFGARYERWSLFADAYGGFLDAKVTRRIPTRFCTLQVEGRANMNPVIADVAVGYQLGEWEIPEWYRPLSVGVYLGTRIVHLGVELEASGEVVDGIRGGGNSVSDSFTTATPMIGLRWEIPIYDRLSLDFRGDLGGLPGGDRLNWSFLGDLRYWLEWSPWGIQPWLEVGYRVVGFNHDFGGGNDFALQLRGPLMAMGVAF